MGPDPKQLIFSVLKEYKIHNAEVVVKEDVRIDEFIDIIEGNRKYVKCLYAYNKIDVLTVEEVDELARRPNCLVISCNMNLNLDYLVAKMWEYLGLVRVYTKTQGLRWSGSFLLVL